MWLTAQIYFLQCQNIGNFVDQELDAEIARYRVAT